MSQQENWPQGAWGNQTPPQTSNPYQQTYQSGAPVDPAAASAHQGAAYAAGWTQPQAGQPAYAPQTPPPPTPPRKRGWIVALVAVILFFAVVFFGVASCSAALSSAMDPFSALEEESSTALITGDTVGIIDISGTIQYDGTTASPEGLKEQLDIAEDDPDIKAVVLRVDSGGGTATAGEEMSLYVREFSKPIVVSSASINASAAYEFSSQADYIFTAKTTAIGAIGTVMQVTDLSGLYDKLGINVENITSAESKDSSYGTRALTEEERAYYQAQVDQINDTFVQTVAEGRGMTEQEVRVLATGMTFTGLDAVENGLADEVGTLEDAVAKAAELAGCGACDTVYLQPSYSDLSALLGLMGASADAKASALSALKEWETYAGIQ